MNSYWFALFNHANIFKTKSSGLLMLCNTDHICRSWPKTRAGWELRRSFFSCFGFIVWTYFTRLSMRFSFVPRTRLFKNVARDCHAQSQCVKCWCNCCTISPTFIKLLENWLVVTPKPKCKCKDLCIFQPFLHSFWFGHFMSTLQTWRSVSTDAVFYSPCLYCVYLWCQTCFTLSKTIKYVTLLFRLNENCAHLVY